MVFLLEEKRGKSYFLIGQKALKCLCICEKRKIAPMSLGIDVESKLSCQINHSYFPVICDYNSPNSSLFSSQSPELESRTPFLKSYRLQFENLI